MKKHFKIPMIFFVICLLQNFSIKETFSQKIEMIPLFSDHIVLQQKTKAVIWGKTEPNTKIFVTGSWGKRTKTRADNNGDWRTKLKTPRAGGPFHIMIATATDTVRLNDVLVGEVWLCSGQSNMEMPLKGWPPNDPIENSEEVVRTASYENIRMFTVTRSFDMKPQTTLKGAWEVCSPETAGNFSATAYFFGRKIHETLGIPVGLIHSSWGGTPAEAWTSLQHLRQLNDFADKVQKLDSLQIDYAHLKKWLQNKDVVKVDELLGENRWKGLDFGGAALALSEHNDSAWPKMTLPIFWENTKMHAFDGVVWFRKQVNIPASWQNKDIILELCPIDDMDRTYVNGELVGGIELHGFWQEKRSYKIPASIVKPGENVIAVRILDTGGGGGIHGSADEMRIFPEGQPDSTISLAGEWRYLPIADFRGDEFRLFGTTVKEYKTKPKLSMSLGGGTPTVLYNAMIAPLVPYSIKGAIWYQGESNVGRAEQYKDLFPTMIQSWRDVWKKKFPFYFVQIAPYRYSGAENTESAELRFAQNQALKMRKTGQAVTLDIGNVDNIHPANKKDVGERLARWALAKDYKQKSVRYSGPVCKSAKRKKEQVILKFDPGAERLVAGKNGLQEFEFVFKDDTAIEVEATIQGKKIVLPLEPGQNPIAVRYAWRNGSTASLFNSAGLPASTFYILIK